jgi:16S rRNA (adenine1518-N6/adenine1519-N6)-dimethyltransferase
MAPAPDDTFIEIGPGRGALTAQLAGAAGHVTAVEIDRDLAAHLQATAPANLTVVEADFLALPIDQLLARLAPGTNAVRVAGNLPYNIASPILVRLVDLYAAGFPVTDATVMVQREVAERILAPVGSKDYSVLSILIRQWASAEHQLSLPPGAFRPAPKVHSTVIRLTFHAADPAVADVAGFRLMAQALFSRRRKMLSNAIQAFTSSRSLAEAALTLAGIDGHRRPETLTLEELGQLFAATLSGQPSSPSPAP